MEMVNNVVANEKEETDRDEFPEALFSEPWRLIPDEKEY